MPTAVLWNGGGGGGNGDIRRICDSYCGLKVSFVYNKMDPFCLQVSPDGRAHFRDQV